MEDTTDYKLHYYKVQHEAVHLADKVDELEADNAKLKTATKSVLNIYFDEECDGLHEAMTNLNSQVNGSE